MLSVLFLSAASNDGGEPYEGAGGCMTRAKMCIAFQAKNDGSLCRCPSNAQIRFPYFGRMLWRYGTTTLICWRRFKDKRFSFAVAAGLGCRAVFVKRSMILSTYRCSARCPIRYCAYFSTTLPLFCAGTERYVARNHIAQQRIPERCEENSKR